MIARDRAARSFLARRELNEKSEALQVYKTLPPLSRIGRKNDEVANECSKDSVNLRRDDDDRT